MFTILIDNIYFFYIICYIIFVNIYNSSGYVARGYYLFWLGVIIMSIFDNVISEEHNTELENELKKKSGYI